MAASPDGSTCTEYDSPRDAFLQAIAGDPLVLAIGEVHAPKDASVPSAAARFTDDLLPALAGRASDLLLELMRPPSACLDAAAEVRRMEEPVTSRHAETAQDEYITMGERARALGIVPDLLRPTCADMEAMREASPGDFLDVSLSTIARLSRAQAARLIDRDALSDADRGKLVVLYGGALHNLLAPDLASADSGPRWSYARELQAQVHGRFVALDLVVPEFVSDDAAWRSLPWWPLYDRARRGARFGQKAVLLARGTTGALRADQVLVFPATFPP
jgi:hypothetical protein